MSQIGALVSGLWGDAGSNFVNEQGGPDAVFGTKPQVADFTPIDLAAETGKATAGNLQNYGAVTELLNKISPGFSDMLAKGSQNTLSELSGEIPQDVQDQVMRSSAFQSLMGGFSGTNMAHALTARDLGRTSLDLTNMGTNSAQSWAKYAQDAYSPFTVSTGEQAATTAANNQGKQAHDQYQFNVDAAPDPGAAGVFNLDTALGEQMLSIGGAFAGGGMGGGSRSTPTQQSPMTYGIVGGSGNDPAYQYNSSTGTFVQVPRATGAWG